MVSRIEFLEGEVERFTYNVRAGDTLSRIASVFSTTVDQILNDNALIENPNVIFAGQPIIITGSRPATLHADLSRSENSTADPIWWKIAEREVGVSEVAGPEHNPRIIEYLMTCETLSASDQRKDETYWCSAFVNWVIEQSGLPGTNSAWALNWQNWGKRLDKPKKGAIAVFSRGEGGHVGFVHSDLGDRLRILGGNQSNSVRLQNFPKDGMLGSVHYKLKACRWPAGV